MWIQLIIHIGKVAKNLFAFSNFYVEFTGLQFVK